MRDVLHIQSFSKSCALLTLAFSVSSAQVSANEDFLVQVWDTDAGLPDSSVTSIAQTPDGYLWVGTSHGGLARFDGQRFVNFHPGNTPALNSIEIRKLVVDLQGTLWVGTVEGELLSYRDNRFQFECLNTETPAAWLSGVLSSSTNSVVLTSSYGWLLQGTLGNGTNRWESLRAPGGYSNPSTCRDGQGTIWYRTSEGRLGQFRTNQFVRVTNPPGLRSPQINTLLTDGAGTLWVGTDKELARWDGGKFVNMTPTNGEPDLNIQQMVACPDGSLWIKTDRDLRKYREQQWVAHVEAWDGGEPQLFTFPLMMNGDARGGLWFSLYGKGVWHVNASGQVSRLGEAQGLPNALVECYFEDREGNVWLGMTGGGLACVRERIFHTIWPVTSQSHLLDRSVCQDQTGAMWFGASANVVLRWENGVFSSFTPDPEQSSGFDTTVFPGAAGQLWVGYVGNGVFTLEGDKFTRPFPAADIGTVARVIYRDRAGRIWIGSEFGLFCWEKGALKRFVEADGFTAAYVLAITEDSHSNLWIGTAAGELRCYRDGKFTTFIPKDSPVAHLVAASEVDAFQNRNRGVLSGGERFWALYADAEGAIWIGGLGGGLLRFEAGQFTRYTSREGLPSEHINQILEDARGRLWVGTQNGIVQVSKAALNRFAGGEKSQLRFVAYGKLDGLPTAECSGGCQPACWRSRDGHLWFTTRKGAVWVDPEEVRSNPLPPPVVIEDIAVDGHSVAEDKQLAESPAIRLPSRLTVLPGRHYLDFKFTAPSLTSPDRVRFKWRLAGLEREWGRESNRRSVSYSFVPPGDYEFQVQACNSDGVWNETGAAIKLTVQPYFWQTRWFPLVATVGLVVISAASVALGLRARHRRRLARLEVLRVTELERSRIARDLHDELGSGLTEVTMLTAPFPGADLSSDKLRERLRRAGDRAHGLVDALDEIVWAVDPAKDNLPALAKYFAGYVEDYLKDSNIACLVQMPVTFPEWSVPAQVRHQLFLAVREAVTNAVRHARPGRIEFTMKLAEERQLEINVTDDGHGFDAATVAAGNGLANQRTRLASVGGYCEIISQLGGGTTVKLTVALSDKI